MLGRVGVGKSTLCMALNGLVPHATGGIFRGAVTVLGRNTKEHAIADLAQSAGLVFQDPEMQLYADARRGRSPCFGPENLGVPTGEIEERVTWALDAVGLGSYRDRPRCTCRVARSNAWRSPTPAMRPQVLALDEPTANLDPAGKAAIFNLLARLARERQIAIVLATQELERVACYV